jgi:hypothetical protein
VFQEALPEGLVEQLMQPVKVLFLSSFFKYTAGFGNRFTEGLDLLP